MSRDVGYRRYYEHTGLMIRELPGMLRHACKAYQKAMEFGYSADPRMDEVTDVLKKRYTRIINLKSRIKALSPVEEDYAKKQERLNKDLFYELVEGDADLMHYESLSEAIYFELLTETFEKGRKKFKDDEEIEED